MFVVMPRSERDTVACEKIKTCHLLVMNGDGVVEGTKRTCQNVQHLKHDFMVVSE